MLTYLCLVTSNIGHRPLVSVLCYHLHLPPAEPEVCYSHFFPQAFTVALTLPGLAAIVSTIQFSVAVRPSKFRFLILNGDHTTQTRCSGWQGLLDLNSRDLTHCSNGTARQTVKQQIKHAFSVTQFPIRGVGFQSPGASMVEWYLTCTCQGCS